MRGGDSCKDNGGGGGVVTGSLYLRYAGPMAYNPNLYELAYHESFIFQWQSVPTAI